MITVHITVPRCFGDISRIGLPDKFHLRSASICYVKTRIQKSNKMLTLVDVTGSSDSISVLYCFLDVSLTTYTRPLIENFRKFFLLHCNLVVPISQFYREAVAISSFFCTQR